MANILIVDDDADILEVLQDMLTPEHRVSVTTDPDRALEQIRRDASIDLVVTDIRMPHRNGFMLIQQAKAIRPALHFMVISAYYDPTDDLAHRVVERYAPVALGKPITRAGLGRAIAAALPER